MIRQLGQKKIFLNILSSLDMNSLKVVLPYNLQDFRDNNAYTIDWSPLGDTMVIVPQYPQPKYDSAYWSNNKLTSNTNINPWIPFVSNCLDYGSHVLLYDLLEDNKKCSLVDQQDTKSVSEIPLLQFKAHSDTCTNTITCTYSQSLNLQTPFKKWYDLEGGQVIFYLTRKAYSFQEYIQLRSDDTKVLGMIAENNKDIVPIKLNTNGHKGAGYYPTKVLLQLFYKQEDTVTKYLIKGELILSDYATIASWEATLAGLKATNKGLVQENPSYSFTVDL